MGFVCITAVLVFMPFFETFFVAKLFGWGLHPAAMAEGFVPAGLPACWLGSSSPSAAFYLGVCLCLYCLHWLPYYLLGL